jgi:hypothetical protein
MSNTFPPCTREYATRVIQKHARKSILNESMSVSSCPSSSSDSDTSKDKPKPRFLRLKYTLSASSSDTEIPATYYVIPHEKSKEKGVIVIPNFLSPKKISKLVSLLESSSSVYTIEDRKSDLVYSHSAKRVEVCLRTEYERMYRKIMTTTVALFDRTYGPMESFAKKSRVFPECEYIVYENAGAFIEPHVDNHSIVTGIVMLSDPSVDFEGGTNCFEPKREYKMNRGDCVLFRGEKVEHWITPVPKGTRKILQWEFSRI